MGIKERKEREKQQRRIDIINAAEEVFSSKGYDNSTMDDIAARAELAKGTLYLYFNTKSEICLTIAVRGLNLLKQMIEKTARQSKKNIEKLREILATCLQYQKKYPKYARALVHFRDYIEQCRENSEMLEQAWAENDAIVTIIRGIIQNGILDKTINADIDADKLALALWGQMSGFLPNLAFERTKHPNIDKKLPESSAEHTDYLYNLIIQGITR